MLVNSHNGIVAKVAGRAINPPPWWNLGCQKIVGKFSTYR